MPIIANPIQNDNARPVDWAEMQDHLRLTSDYDKTYVEGLVDAATDYAEEELGMSLMARTRTDVFYDGATSIVLPSGPLISITSITDAASRTITAYTLSKVGQRDILTITGAFTAPLTVVRLAGHVEKTSVAASIRHAIKMHAATLYENRETVSEKAKTPVPQTLKDFYRLKRRNVGVG